ncbi:MAG: hypothetical protein ACKVZJ_14265 [Phycisphaerales bacterium]
MHSTTAPPGAAGAQRTFDHLRTEQHGPRAAQPRPIVRELAHADTRERIDELAEGREDPAQDAALRTLKRLVRDFLVRLGTGGEFQSVDFTAWLDQTGQRPAGIDLRGMGGIWGGLLRRGWIVSVGYRADGGNPHTPGDRHNSAVRPVFRIVTIPPPPEPQPHEPRAHEPRAHEPRA